MQEQRLILFLIRWIGLQHADSLNGTIDEKSLELVRDHIIFFMERFQGRREGIFVPPASPALGYERVIILRPVIIVVCGQTERLIVSARRFGHLKNPDSYLPMPLLVPYYLA